MHYVSHQVPIMPQLLHERTSSEKAKKIVSHHVKQSRNYDYHQVKKSKNHVSRQVKKAKMMLLVKSGKLFFNE